MKTYLLRYIFAATALCVGAVFLVIAPYLYAHARHALQGTSHVVPTEHSQVVLPPNMVFIPSLGIQAPVLEPDGETESAFQIALERGVVHYPGSALPGETGNMYVFGHSSDYLWRKGDFKTVFALLPNIEKDATIFITDQGGVMFTYTVKETFVVGPRDRWVLTSFGPEERLLTLQTSYPLGTALKRFIVRAELQ